MSLDNKYERILHSASIRITAVRILVLKMIYERLHGDAFSLHDVMREMGNADNSSVFRTLTLFAEKDILNTIDDGSGMQKYCLCISGGDSHQHRHVHFTCTSCHRTVCLKDVPIPHVPLPNSYVVEDMELVIKGLCPNCTAKKL